MQKGRLIVSESPAMLFMLRYLLPFLPRSLALRISRKTQEQEQRFERWLEELRGDRLVVVECGAGSAVPTVRWQSEQLVAAFGGALVRINTREPDVPARPGRRMGTADPGGDGIGISLGALEALRAIAARLPQGDTGRSS